MNENQIGATWEPCEDYVNETPLEPCFVPLFILTELSLSLLFRFGAHTHLYAELTPGSLPILGSYLVELRGPL